MFELVLEKAEEPEIKWPKSVGSLEKQESSRKTSAAAGAITKSLQSCRTLCNPIVGSPLQYSGLGNSMDCIVHGVTESDTTERFSLYPVYNRFNSPLEPHPQDGRENN